MTILTPENVSEFLRSYTILPDLLSVKAARSFIEITGKIASSKGRRFHHMQRPDFMLVFKSCTKVVCHLEDARDELEELTDVIDFIISHHDGTTLIFKMMTTSAIFIEILCETIEFSAEV